MFNLGPIDMPMAKGEVLMTLASQFQPNKFGNATEIVGALHQDRHSAIMGVLGATAEMVPVNLKVRSFGDSNTVRKEKDLHFSVFVQQKWTPYLMMLTLFNSISGLNEFADEATYRISGKVMLDGQQDLSLATMLAPSELPVPTPMQMAGWWGEKFNRLFLNSVQHPETEKRRCHHRPASRSPCRHHRERLGCRMRSRGRFRRSIKVFLRPYRGDRIERDFTLRFRRACRKASIVFC